MDQQAKFFTAAEQTKAVYITPKRTLFFLAGLVACGLACIVIVFLTRQQSPYPFEIVIAGEKEVIQDKSDHDLFKSLALTEACKRFRTPVGIPIAEIKKNCMREGEFISGCISGKAETHWRDSSHFEFNQEFSCWGRGIPTRDFKTRWLVDLPAGEITPLNDDATAFMGYPLEIDRMILALKAKAEARRNRPSLSPAEIIAEVTKDSQKIPNEFTYGDIFTRWFPGAPKQVLRAESHDPKRVLLIEGSMPTRGDLTEETVVKICNWWKPYMEWALGPRDIEAGEKAIANAWIDRNTSARLRGQADGGTGFGLGPGYSIQCDMHALNGKHGFTFTLRSY